MLKEGIFLAVAAWTTTVHPAGPPMRWLYPYKIMRVLDGDTVQVEAKWQPSPLKPWVFIRLAGIDTPERGGKAKCIRERKLAEEAALFAENAIYNSKDVSVEIKGNDKYGGRYLGDIWLGGKSLSEMLINEGLAKHYYGEKKPDWCVE